MIKLPEPGSYYHLLRVLVFSYFEYNLVQLAGLCPLPRSKLGGDLAVTMAFGRLEGLFLLQAGASEPQACDLKLCQLICHSDVGVLKYDAENVLVGSTIMYKLAEQKFTVLIEQLRLEDVLRDGRKQMMKQKISFQEKEPIQRQFAVDEWRMKELRWRRQCLRLLSQLACEYLRRDRGMSHFDETQKAQIFSITAQSIGKRLSQATIILSNLEIIGQEGVDCYNKRIQESSLRLGFAHYRQKVTTIEGYLRRLLPEIYMLLDQQEILADSKFGLGTQLQGPVAELGRHLYRSVSHILVHDKVAGPRYFVVYSMCIEAYLNLWVKLQQYLPPVGCTPFSGDLVSVAMPQGYQAILAELFSKVDPFEADGKMPIFQYFGVFRAVFMGHVGLYHEALKALSAGDLGFVAGLLARFDVLYLQAASLARLRPVLGGNRGGFILADFVWELFFYLFVAAKQAGHTELATLGYQKLIRYKLDDKRFR